jgi:ACS family pantothenate transporter-like MFS transporter
MSICLPTTLQWTVGYVIGQIPSQIILTKVRPSIWVPSCELVWTVLTFCLAAAKTSNQVIGIRFFVGLAESIFYPAAHTILGSWYKPSELGKRACIFHASSAAASMFSGYLQAGVYQGLNGVGGLAGWKWLFVSPGAFIKSESWGMLGNSDRAIDHGRHHQSPHLHRRLLLDSRSSREHESVLFERECKSSKPHCFRDGKSLTISQDRALAQKRMALVGRAPRTKLGRSAFKRVFGQKTPPFEGNPGRL